MSGRWIRWAVTAPFAVLTFAVSAMSPVAPAAAVPLAVQRNAPLTVQRNAPSTAQQTGTVYVVNALAGVTAQVLVDGEVVREASGPKTVIGPLTLAEGKHVLELRTEEALVAGASFTLAVGDDLDVVAHRSADRAAAPLITVFRNDLSAVGPGKARLVVSHVAVAEPADVRIDDKPYFRNVANAESLSVVVPAGSYELGMVATADPQLSLLDPVPLTVGAGSLTRVFAFGDADQRAVDAVIQSLTVPVAGSRAPVIVRTGDGGQAAAMFATSSAPVGALLVVVVAGLGLAGAAGTRLGTTRSLRPVGVRRQVGVRPRS
ncbi:MAG: hypothetical protein QG622_1087 [Actinomycetota bacterium]|nr:hypothetical protein [Actinomycetota bacterium]